MILNLFQYQVVNLSTKLVFDRLAQELITARLNHKKLEKMELKLIYDFLKIQAEKLMIKGDVSGYLRTLARLNEIKLQLATA